MNSPLLQNVKRNVIAPAAGSGRVAVSDVIREWPAEALFDAAGVLAQHPELSRQKSAVLDLAYEEYCQRIEAGEDIDPLAFAGRFPGAQRSLLALLDVHQFLSENPHLLTSLPDVQWPAAGETFLGFRLNEELGRGAASRVFLGTETALGDRQVVVKVCWRGAEEAHFLGKLDHPHIVPVFSVQSDSDSGLNAICMPHVSRATLFDVLDAVYGEAGVPARTRRIRDAIDRVNGAADQSRSTPRVRLFGGSYVTEIARIGAQLAGALSYTHDRGICHGDVKPSNVLITPCGSAMLLDFNLSFHTRELGGGVGGTVYYMAPEGLQAIGRGGDAVEFSLDPRADLYSLGVTLYEALSGRLPFRTASPGLTQRQTVDWLLEQQRRGFQPLRKLNHRVDTRLARLVERCLAFDPQDRPQSAAEVADELKASLALGRRVLRCCQTHPMISASVLVALSLALASLGYTLATREPYGVRQLQAGWQAQARGDWDEAISHFSRALDADERSADALFARGRAYLHSGEMQLAYKDFGETAEIVVDGRVTACRAYCACLLDKQYGSATNLFKQAIDQGFAPAAVYNDLGFCYLQTGKLKEAVSCLRKAAQFDPNLQAAFYNLGIAEFRLTLRDQQSGASARWAKDSVSHLTAAIRIGPPSADLYLQSAVAHAMACRLQSEGVLADREQHLTQTLACCRTAIDLGLDPAALNAVAACYAPLKNDSRFTELKSSPAAAFSPQPSVRLIDPLGDVEMPIALRPQRLQMGG